MMMPYDNYGNLFFVPFIPVMNERPPTLYSLLQSIVNYGKDEQTKIKDLAKAGRTKIFDFDYPLSDKITKEDFECMILNHFIMRRIGFDTLTAFKIQLDVKLNEIMPMYNKLIDLLYEENAFGEITKKTGKDNRVVQNATTNEMENSSNTSHENISDRRGSDTPQNHLENIRDGSYVTEYHYDKDNSKNTDTSKSNGKSNSNTKDDNVYEETTSRINLFEVYAKLNEEIKNIYTMIFKDLDCLFYQLV
jgi:hypothetical protein